MTDLTSWIGRRQITVDTICPRLATWLAATLDRPALMNAQSGTSLPAGWHWMFFNPVEPQAGLGLDGHPARGGFLPPITLPRRMWAGSRLQWHRPFEIGNRMERESTILRIEQKSGKNGDMVLVTVGHQYRDGASLVLEEEQDIVYRGNSTDEERSAMASIKVRSENFKSAFERKGEHLEVIKPDPIMLFRFSAATLNGHRIHYDLPYAMNDEGYPGLVVHGPLIATMLLGLVERHMPDTCMLREFEFRAKRPTFAISPFHLHIASTERANENKLWSTNNVGEVALDCRASW